MSPEIIDRVDENPRYPLCYEERGDERENDETKPLGKITQRGKFLSWSSQVSPKARFIVEAGHRLIIPFLPVTFQNDSARQALFCKKNGSITEDPGG